MVGSVPVKKNVAPWHINIEKEIIKIIDILKNDLYVVHEKLLGFLFAYLMLISSPIVKFKPSIEILLPAKSPNLNLLVSFLAKYWRGSWTLSLFTWLILMILHLVHGPIKKF